MHRLPLTPRPATPTAGFFLCGLAKRQAAPHKRSELGQNQRPHPNTTPRPARRTAVTPPTRNVSGRVTPRARTVGTVTLIKKKGAHQRADHQ